MIARVFCMNFSEEIMVLSAYGTAAVVDLDLHPLVGLPHSGAASTLNSSQEGPAPREQKVSNGLEMGGAGTTLTIDVQLANQQGHYPYGASHVCVYLAASRLTAACLLVVVPRIRLERRSIGCRSQLRPAACSICRLRSALSRDPVAVWWLPAQLRARSAVCQRGPAAGTGLARRASQRLGVATGARLQTQT